MAAAMPPRTRKLQRLPQELLQLILAWVADIKSLSAIVKGGRRIYYAFLDDQLRTTHDVLTRQIPPELHHDALAAEMSSRRDIWSRQEAEDFLTNYFARDRQPFHSSFRRTLPEARVVAELHVTIESLTSSFVSSVLAQKPSARPVSRTEQIRIQCNFYRFQIYCNLFRNEKMIPIDADHDQQEAYFAHFAPWENEQLACIHDYLLDIITPAFEEASVNDPDWVNFFVLMDNGLDEGALQHHLSFGLSHIRSFTQTDDAQSQDKPLSSGEKKSNPAFLAAALRESNYLNRWTLEELDSKDEAEFIPTPWFAEPDKGPEDVWRWALRKQTMDQWVFSPAQIPLRRWGYVLWDRARLEEWGVFDSPWEAIDVEEYKQQERSRRLQESGGMQIRAQEMVRRGQLESSWHYS